MNIHKNARTTPHSRILMVRRVLAQKQPAARVAVDFGVSERTVRKWLARWRAGGEPALNDRSSAPVRRRRLPATQVAAIEALRRQRLTSPVIARRLGLPLSTVGTVLRRRGLGRLKRLDPPAPVVRYQRERPGELVHIDTKKLGKIAGIGHRITGRRSGMVNRHRGIGWEYLHVAVDDASRLAYTEILPDERKASAIAFLARTLAWFARHGVKIERIMTDNGNAYRSHDFRAACARAGVRHLRTKPYTPAPTARPIASSRPSGANAPTPAPFDHPRSAPPRCPTGCTSKTSTGRTPPSPDNHRSAGSPRTTCSVTTPS
jgi:transposase InsO family protein